MRYSEYNYSYDAKLRVAVYGNDTDSIDWKYCHDIAANIAVDVKRNDRIYNSTHNCLTIHRYDRNANYRYNTDGQHSQYCNDDTGNDDDR